MPRAETTPLHVVARAQQREVAIQALGYEDYAAYLRSPTWRAVRKRYAEQQPWICNVCGATESLHLHHRTYERVGQEELTDLMPLCANCHELAHVLERRGDANLDFEGIVDRARALHNRAEMAAKREAIEVEQQADLVAFREFLETLPLDQRLGRLRRFKRDKTLAAAKLRSKRRGTRRAAERGNLTREFLIRHVRAMEAIAYGFEVEEVEP